MLFRSEAVFFGPGGGFYPEGRAGGGGQGGGEAIRIAYSWPPQAALAEAAERLQRVFSGAARA